MPAELLHTSTDYVITVTEIVQSVQAKAYAHRSKRPFNCRKRADLKSTLFSRVVFLKKRAVSETTLFS
jgi:hypothetical protein